MQRKDIPNYITGARIILSPLIVPVMWMGAIEVGSILFIITALTDFIDGKLARKWNAWSIEGKYLDTIADKEFAFLTLLAGITYTPVLIIPLLLESAIATVSTLSFIKKYKIESAIIGKVKTGFLSVTTGLTLLATFLSLQSTGLLEFLIFFLTGTTVLLELGTLETYIKHYYIEKQKKKQQEMTVTKQPNHLSDEVVLDHMKQFTFYQSKLFQNPKMMALYRDKLIPEKLETLETKNQIGQLDSKNNCNLLTSDEHVLTKKKVP